MCRFDDAMNRTGLPLKKLSSDPAVEACLERLKYLFHWMDETYCAHAQAYGFYCSGCKNNCCYSRFYHHTVSEILFLYKGVQTLREDLRHALLRRAEANCASMNQADDTGAVARLICPLNVEERCMLYDFRPMICRLHGIPYELQRPDAPSKRVCGRGCDAFEQHCGAMPYRLFDRTPLYFEMARLEKSLKEAAGIRQKIRMTVAEMIVLILNSESIGETQVPDRMSPR
jgi:Fe-S-cluster containining protein